MNDLERYNSGSSDGKIEDCKVTLPKISESATEESTFLSTEASSFHLTRIAEGGSIKESHENKKGGKLRVPPRKFTSNLYHRSEEAELKLLYEHSVDAENCSLILLTGRTGTGKTHLAQTLESAVQKRSGFFLKVKFDQRMHPIPYAALISAVTQFVHIVVEEGETATLQVREAVGNHVGDGIEALTSIIPELEVLLGKSRTAHLPMKAAAVGTQRFVFTFHLFLQAICTLKRPIVVLLDNFHYADPCTLDILSFVVADGGQQGLVLLVTCDVTEVGTDSYLAVKLRDIERQTQAQIHTLNIDHLDLDSTEEFLAGSLEAEKGYIHSLGTIVFQETGGNFLFMMEFLRRLSASDLLYFDHDIEQWKWDVSDIRTMSESKTVHEFLAEVLEQVSRDHKDVLKVASCLGSQIDESLIEMVLGFPVLHYLEESLRCGLLHFDKICACLTFANDVTEQAVYSLIPQTERPLFHLEIGRRLWRRLSDDCFDKKLFIVLSQMRMGQNLITRNSERTKVAWLCLHAGRRAAMASAFQTSRVYLVFGIELLENTSWRENYDLTLALHNSIAEVDMCLALFESMDTCLAAILSNARTFSDKLSAYRTKIHAFGIREHQIRAIGLGMEVLQGLGEKFPKRHLAFHLRNELKGLRAALKGKSDEQLLRLPIIGNPEKLAAIQILHTLMMSCMLAKPEYLPFVILRMLKLTLIYGLSPLAATAFAAYGMLCIPSECQGDVDVAFRFGDLGLLLLKRFKAIEFCPRVYALYFGCIYCWKKPLKDAMDPLLHGHRIGMHTGDDEFASVCASIYCIHAFEVGVSLHSMRRVWEGIYEWMLSKRQSSLLSISLPWLQALHHFMGLSDDPLSSKGNLIDYDDAVFRAEAIGATVYVVGIRYTQMILAYIFNDYEKAATISLGLQDISLIPPTIERMVGVFYLALTSLAMVKRKTLVRQNLKVAKRSISTLKKWADHSPYNCLEKLLLVQAELASAQNQNSRASTKYILAIAMSKESNLLMNQALSNERAARHFQDMGDTDAAKPFFVEALRCYEEWGGNAKVVRLFAEVSQIYGSEQA
jgi:predicted ATPase